MNSSSSPLLTYLLATSISDETSFASKSQLLKSIDDLKMYATTQLKTTTDSDYKGHLLLTIERMKSPENSKPTLHQAPPPGSPIGCGEN